MDEWQQVQQLFDAALQHSSEKRQEFLDQECGSNRELRREVESLLAAHEQSGSFMAEPAVAGMADVLQRGTSRFEPGDTLGGYKVVNLVGRGGMGEVYRARDTRLKRDVAIKVLPRAFAADRERLRRFEQEARSAAALNHPNIISVHDMGTADGSPYIVSELLQGQNLRELLRQGPIPARKVLDYALQVARGLAAAHDAGIVHRDLKPENLFITKNGQLKILDFGLAKLTRSDELAPDNSSGDAPKQTEAGSVFGTIGYMSPEQVRGLAADFRSDIFSFGAILYELFSGKRAFSGNTAADTMSAILHQDPPELTRATPPVHPAVDHTIRHCLEKNPLERFQSAHDLRFQLQVAAEGLFSKTEPTLTDSSRLRPRWVLLVIALMLVAAAFPFLIMRFSAKPELPVYKRLTFRSGIVSTARFSSDGRTIIYGAAWEGNPSEIFVSRVGGSDARPLGIGPSELLSVSKNGELAVLLKPQSSFFMYTIGTLATVPLEGGTPREIAEDVTSADWTPDGISLAIVRARTKLEFPIGKVLFQSAGWLSHPRFSPDGKSISFIDHPSFGALIGSFVTCDLKGTAKVIAKGFDSAGGVAWAPNGKEVWISGTRGGETAQQIFAISRDGKERLVTRGAGSMTLHDIAHDGQLLFSRDDLRQGIKALAPDNEERDLSWFDVSLMGAISADGEMVAFSESGEATALKTHTYVRGIRGTPAVRLGEGRPWSISLDKKWVVVTTDSFPPQLVLLPTGSGEPKRYPPSKGEIAYPTFLGDGKQIIFIRVEGGSYRMYLMALDTGEVKPALPEGVTGIVVSPDGKYVVASGASDTVDRIYDLTGGPPRPIMGLREKEVVRGWGRPPLPLYVDSREGSVRSLFRLDPDTGQRRFWHSWIRSHDAGVWMNADLRVATDAQAYGYTYYSTLSQLYIAEGLR
jgi:eukaryotic-like serine/threonine-protein kinase